MLRAMIRTVARRGYDRTTVSRVLADAQTHEALFSEHFRDKQDCFMQALEELIGGAERAAVERFERPLPWSERVRAALGDLLGGLAEDSDAARVAFVEALTAGAAAQERQRRALALFTKLVEQGRPRAPLGDGLPPQTSEAIVGGIAAILHRRVLQGETATLPALLADLTYFALLPYVGHDRALLAAEQRQVA
jgi:AcrR family transcriptional regulator